MLLIALSTAVLKTWSAIIIVVCETHLWPCMSTVLVMSLIDKHCHTSNIDAICCHITCQWEKLSTIMNDASRCNYFDCINLESSQKMYKYIYRATM